MSKHRRKVGLCPNCNEILAAEDNFCKKCGQENHDLNVPFHHLVGEFIESIFHIDTKFWHTFKAIFTKPGKITTDFVAGKRASYMPPARLYIFMSFVFFLLVTVVADKFIEKNSPEKLKSLMNVTNDFEIDGKKVKFKSDEVKMLKKYTNFQLDSVLIAHEIVATPQNREKIKTETANFDAFIKSITGDGKTSMVQDSVSKRIISIDSSEINSIKNYSDKQLHEFLASKNVFPTAYDFQDFKDDIREFKDNLEGNKIINGKPVSKNVNNVTFNGISTKILDKAPEHLTSENLDSLLTANKIELGFRNRLTVKVYHAYKKFSYEKDSRELSHKFFKNLSWVMFILMPFVAIILLTIYYRSKRNYYEYFIFSIHIHSILFLAMSLELIIRLLLKSNSVMPYYSFIVMYFYFLFSIKNVYKQGWWKTILKFIFLNISYFIIFVIFFIGAFVWSFITLE